MDITKTREKAAAAAAAIGRILVNAICKHQGSKGITFLQLKQKLFESKQLDILENDEEIIMALKIQIHAGVLSEKDEYYKCNELPDADDQMDIEEGISTIETGLGNLEVIEVNAPAISPSERDEITGPSNQKRPRCNSPKENSPSKRYKQK